MFEFNSLVKKQATGGAIGLELNGDVAHMYMVWYNHQLGKKMEVKEINALLYRRYMDDINMIFNIPHTNANCGVSADKQ